MKKLTDQDPETKSPDLIAENIEQLKALFPEAFTEDKIDFEVLKQILGGTVDEREEKYGLNWYGKRRARQIALTPSTGTLRPCPEDSVDWDTTQNLMIEGDNLEVLKLLQKSYAGKVKLIYIDPPYNTGNNFVYPDDFQDNIKNYLELIGQVESGRKISSNTEASGRFHTDWLNMMYPRLKLARNLLREDGVIFISIDDHESVNVRKLCDEVFGEENFIVQFVWRSRLGKGGTANQVAPLHEYIITYAKSAELLEFRRDIRVSEGDKERLRQWGQGDRREDRPSMYFDIQGPEGTRVFPIKPDGSDGRWRVGKEKMEELIAAGLVEFELRDDGNYEAYRIIEAGHERYSAVDSILSQEEVSTTAAGSKEIKVLFDDEQPFDYPKPSSLIRYLVNLYPSSDGIVLDYFAGSGTTGHAVFGQNVKDGGRRRFIGVQLPEPTEREDYSTITEIAKERLRRAGKKIKEENPMFAGDLGFRVFKLDSSNIRAWEPDRDNLAATLEQHAEHLKTDRTEQDILFELLLKLGLDLTVPIEQKTIAGKAVHSIGAGTLLVCLATQITAAEVEPLALGIVEWHKQLAPAGETQMVFRDSAFADDVAKTNLTAILQQYGLENVRSL